MIENYQDLFKRGLIKIPDSDVFFHRKPRNWGVPEFSIATQYIKNYRVCLDIGAHVGVMTLRYAQYFQTVHSFEPLVHNFLVENTKHLSNVIIHNYAVSDKNKTIEIYPNPQSSSGGIIPDEYNDCFIKKRYEGPNAQMPDVEKVLVECLPIDQFDYNEVDFIKIDVEGHILPVIEGMMETLTNNSPVVQIEMSRHEDSKKLNKLVHDIFVNLGYCKFDTYDEDHFYYKVEKNDL